MDTPTGAQTRTPFGLKLVILPSTVRSVLAHKCAPRTSTAAAAGCLHTASSPQGSNRAGDPRKAHCLVARTGFGNTSLATQQGAQLTRPPGEGVSTHNPNTVRVVFVSRCELRAMHARKVPSGPQAQGRSCSGCVSTRWPRYQCSHTCARVQGPCCAHWCALWAVCLHPVSLQLAGPQSRPEA